MNPQPIPAHEHWIIVGFTAAAFFGPIIAGIALDTYRAVRNERRAQARANHPTARRQTR